MSGGHDPRELSRKAVEARRRYAASRVPSQTASEGLRGAAQAQYEIATGPKSIPPAARTAAARAYAELVVAAEAAEEREGGKAGVIAWDTMPPATMRLLRLVLDASSEQVEEWLGMVEEWLAREGGEERAHVARAV